MTIYGQSGQSGSLNVPNPPSNVSGAIYCNKGSFIINGGTVNAHGEQNAIFCDHGNFIINRGTVNATGNSTSGIGIRAKYVTINGGNVTTNAKYGIKIDYSEGNITINGGNVTANGTWGIYANYIDITLGWSNDSDRIYASQYFVSDGHTINIAEGKYFKDDNGNCYFGTVRANDINNKTLQPATQTEYIQYRLGTGNDGSAQHPYTISDANDWNAFCLALYDNDNWNRFSGKIVKLDANISVTRMAGSDYHDFCGTFDGRGHTITLNGNSENGCYALFRNVSTDRANTSDTVDTPAAIRNLHVTGTITTTSKYAAGLISGKWGNVTIENCRSSVIINSSVPGDGTHAGLVAVNNNFSLDIIGCVFDGKLLTTKGTTNCGGFVGWNDDTLNISNSIYAPANAASGETWVSNDGSATFARYSTGHAATITNCYYTTDFNNGNDYTGQGKRAHSITAGENVTVENAGTATTYDVSGITSYGTGILYDNVLYAGNGDAVSLTLGNTLPATYNFFGYIVDHGNLSGNDTEGYTLDMPDEDVIITADFCADITNLHIVGEIGNHSVTVGWDNGAGDMFEYAMVAGHNIDLTTVTYEGTTTASENTWNNLNLDSDYTVVLRRQCSTDHYSQALALEIHTDVACPAPYRLAATNSTATTATLNWSGVQDSYNVRYSPCFLAEGFESGTMPDGWTRTGSYWQITSGTGIDIGIDFSDWNGAATGNYNAGCYIEEHNVSDTLITPVMDLGNIASATLYFNFWNTEWDGDIHPRLRGHALQRQRRSHAAKDRGRGTFGLEPRGQPVCRNGLHR